MRKATTLLFLLVFGLLFGQESKIQLKVDKAFFDQTKGKIYASTTTGATLTYMVLPFDHEQAIQGIKTSKNEEMIVISQGFLPGSDIKIYHKKSKLNTDNGEVIIEIYAIQYSDSQTIMLTGNYKIQHAAAVGNKIELTARSVNDL